MIFDQEGFVEQDVARLKRLAILPIERQRWQRIWFEGDCRCVGEGDLDGKKLPFGDCRESWRVDRLDRVDRAGIASIGNADRVGARSAGRSLDGVLQLVDRSGIDQIGDHTGDKIVGLKVRAVRPFDRPWPKCVDFNRS